MNSSISLELPEGVAFKDPLVTIALMEDEQGISSYLAGRLQQAGFLVCLPSSCDECMDFADHGCRAFILDINMGEDRRREGMLALRLLKERDAEIFCAVLTQKSDDKTRREALEYGCDAFLGKNLEDLENFDSVELALDRMWLTRATRLSLSPGQRPVASAIRDRVVSIQKDPDLAITAGDGPENERKSRLISRHQQLLCRSMAGELTEPDREEYERVKQELLELQEGEAEDLERSYPDTPAGRMESRLSRIEEMIVELRRHRDAA